MGYCTEFQGSFRISPPLNPHLKEFLTKLSETRRMKRNVPRAAYGVEGEFYVESKAESGQDFDNPNIIDANEPPETQPSLWCSWIPNHKGTEMVWDGGEKFYSYTDWIEYLVKKILEPNGYKLNGEVKWQGEEMADRGKIVIKNNNIEIIELE